MSALRLPRVAAPKVVDRDPISRSTRQPGLVHFVHPLGSVAFTAPRGSPLTLGAPGCSLDVQAVVAEAFLAQHPDASFFYVTGEQVAAMQLATHRAIPIGRDVVVPLPLQQPPDLARTALRKATKQGLTLEEPADLRPLAAQLREVNAAALAAREIKEELRFLNRPCEFDGETDARTFVVRQRGELIGFVVLDAYVGHAGRGYLLNLFRLKPTKVWNVYQAVVLRLCELLAAEGVAELSLGFVPLAVAPEEAELSWFDRLQLRLLRRAAARSSYLSRLAIIKHGFEARQVTRFLVTRRTLIAEDVRSFVQAMTG
ncbi:MAG: phosphatidylglycerol lysyltransferase domain-containing protein [Myxococcaceae bacterium]